MITAYVYPIKSHKLFKAMILFSILVSIVLIVPVYESQAQTSTIVIKPPYTRRPIYISLYNITVPGHPYVSLPHEDRILIFSTNVTRTNYGPYETEIYVYYPSNGTLISTGVIIPWRVLDVDIYGDYAYLALDSGYYKDHAALGILNMNNYTFDYIDYSPYDYGHAIDIKNNLLVYVAGDWYPYKMIITLYKLPTMTELWRIEKNGVYSLDATISPSGKYIAVTLPGPSIGIYNTNNGSQITYITLGTSSYPTFSVEWIDNNHLITGHDDNVWLLEFQDNVLRVAQHLVLSGESVCCIRYISSVDILIGTDFTGRTSGIKIFKIIRSGPTTSVEYLNGYLPTGLHYYDLIMHGNHIAISDSVNGIITILFAESIVGGKLVSSYIDISINIAIIITAILILLIIKIKYFR